MARLTHKRTSRASLCLMALTALGLAGVAGVGAWGFSERISQNVHVDVRVVQAFASFGLLDHPRPAHSAPPAHPIARPLPRPFPDLPDLPGAPAFPVPHPLFHRAIDGKGNGFLRPKAGSAGVPLNRIAPASYVDGRSLPSGGDRRSARAVSNLVSAQRGLIPNSSGISDFFWQWGQFLDHDIDLTPEHEPEEAFPIAVPLGDPAFDPHRAGNKTIKFKRSSYDLHSGRYAPREQLNKITAFIDASNVYGSDDERARALRANDGTGRLKTTSDGLYLPYNVAGLDNAGGKDRQDLFLAGDVRANEQVGLTAVHTLFVREHNRLAEEIAAAHSSYDDDRIYETARKIVGAQMQVITYREFLPILLGPSGVPPYRGYDPKIDPGILNEFSTAAYRFGHSMVASAIPLVDRHGRAAAELKVRDAFFNPTFLPQNGVDPVFRGLASQRAQELDTKIVDDLRNFLFGQPGSDGLDLAALNIQRGRDHGLADYNTVRRSYGLPAVRTFAEITSDLETQNRLAAAYATVNDVDLWVGGLAEDRVHGAIVGPTFFAILREQFTRLRDGDRFWYQNDPFFKADPKLLREVESTRLSDIIRRNTGVAEELQAFVMRVAQ